MILWRDSLQCFCCPCLQIRISGVSGQNSCRGSFMLATCKFASFLGSDSLSILLSMMSLISFLICYAMLKMMMQDGLLLN